MKVKFTKDYRGWITDEVFYKAGDVFDATVTQEKYLIEMGVIEDQKKSPRKSTVRKPKAVKK